MLGLGPQKIWYNNLAIFLFSLSSAISISSASFSLLNEAKENEGGSKLFNEFHLKFQRGKGASRHLKKGMIGWSSEKTFLFLFDA